MISIPCRFVGFSIFYFDGGANLLEHLEHLEQLDCSAARTPEFFVRIPCRVGLPNYPSTFPIRWSIWSRPPEPPVSNASTLVVLIWLLHACPRFCKICGFFSGGQSNPHLRTFTRNTQHTKTLGCSIRKLGSRVSKRGRTATYWITGVFLGVISPTDPNLWP